MGGDVREAAAGFIEVLLVVSWVVELVGEIAFYGGGLIGGLGEVVAEAARASDPSNFRLEGLCAADGGDVRARSWELRCKLRSILAVVGETCCADRLYRRRIRGRRYRGDLINRSCCRRDERRLRERFARRRRRSWRSLGAGLSCSARGDTGSS